MRSDVDVLKVTIESNRVLIGNLQEAIKDLGESVSRLECRVKTLEYRVGLI